MAQDPKVKRDKVPDLSLVGSTPAAPKRVALDKDKTAPPGPPPLPPSASMGTGAPATAVRVEQGRNEPIPLPAPPPSDAKPHTHPDPKPADKTEASKEGGRKATPPPPPPTSGSPPSSADSAKVVRPLKLSELQRRHEPPRPPENASPVKPQSGPAAAKAPEPHGQAANEPERKADAQRAPSPSAAPGAESSGTEEIADRRPARRRPAGPSRARIAANDDMPSIGGLIYALNERPSNKPFVYAATASGVWAAIAIAFAWAFISRELADATGFIDALGRPATITAFATVVGPVALFWFLALLVWRTEDLRLRSTAMTEVAVRLAEPDRMAEQSIASLGQAVRRQVSFMNEAVSRALGRAGELEALVHNEVTALERSYEDNERKIRSLIQELSGERNALLNTTDRVNEALKSIAGEVPILIEKLSNQQVKLATIIEGAGQNLTALETALSEQTGRLEHTLGSRTQDMQAVLHDYTAALGSAARQPHGADAGGARTVHRVLRRSAVRPRAAYADALRGLQEVHRELDGQSDREPADRV